MSDRKTLTKLYASRYQRAQQKEKGQLLDEFLALTKSGRCYGAWVLRQHGKRVKVAPTREGARYYDAALQKALVKVWSVMDGICSKRLAPALLTLVPKLAGCGELRVTAAVQEKLVQLSAAGFVKLDLVGHEGGNAQGDYCFSLNVTDVLSGWTANARDSEQGASVGGRSVRSDSAAAAVYAARN